MRDFRNFSDKELVFLFKQGNEQCFEEIYKRYYNKLILYARKLLGNYHDAEDVTDKTLLQAFRHLHNFRNEAELSTWLYKILRNQVFNLYRYNNRREIFTSQSLDLITLEENNAFLLAIADWSLPENLIIKREEQQLVTQAVANLPEMLRETAQLYIFEHLPHNVENRQVL